MAPALLLMLAVNTAPASSSTIEAKQHFERAEHLYQRAQYTDAIVEFEEAYRLKPHPVVLFNIGRCFEALGELDKALTSYRQYVREMPGAADRETVEARITNLARRLGTTTLQNAAVGPAAETVKDLPIAPEPAPVEAPLVSAGGGAGEPNGAGPRFQTRGSEIRATTSFQPGSLRYTYVAGGAAGASLLVGFGLGIAALKTRSDYLSTVRSGAENQAMANQIVNLEYAETGAYAVAGVAAGGAVALFIYERWFSPPPGARRSQY